ncbi:hypothetical protein IEQ34_013787 [Dendrobium chrysotoxum]|uniref:Uncharacterized protein n=1 Tax=Dendrobium chrysotoxum TaxID=161865 RepID=A0AAV7GQ51_DENCH|nr:hypothetical protein IEQ34_013787 [Dendrobium chrysotoxum]
MDGLDQVPIRLGGKTSQVGRGLELRRIRKENCPRRSPISLFSVKNRTLRALTAPHSQEMKPRRSSPSSFREIPQVPSHPLFASKKAPSQPALAEVSYRFPLLAWVTALAGALTYSDLADANSPFGIGASKNAKPLKIKRAWSSMENVKVLLNRPVRYRAGRISFGRLRGYTGDYNY